MTSANLATVSHAHPLAPSLRPIVDAGKARALALEILAILLVALDHHALAYDAYFRRGLSALCQWYALARDVDNGEAPIIGEACVDLPMIAAVADRIASQVWCRAPFGQPISAVRWALFDLATMLRRACLCSCATDEEVENTHFLHAYQGHASHHGLRVISSDTATANHLLPLIVEHARRMCAELKIDPSQMEAAIVRLGGTPS